MMVGGWGVDLGAPAIGAAAVGAIKRALKFIQNGGSGGWLRGNASTAAIEEPARGSFFGCGCGGGTTVKVVEGIVAPFGDWRPSSSLLAAIEWEAWLMVPKVYPFADDRRAAVLEMDAGVGAGGAGAGATIAAALSTGASRGAASGVAFAG
jgi:hypothetical protein